MQPFVAIDAATTPGVVGLVVRSLDRSLRFYAAALGLETLDSNEEQAFLGSHGRPLLRLLAQPHASAWPGRGYAGLYHFALLFPSRLGLADALRRLAATGMALDGASDHGVSEAIYLRDPDGHGIELYRDRPRDQWPFAGDSLQMVSNPLDLQDLLGELERTTPAWQGAEPGLRMGHIHLHTHDLTAAQRFYGDGMGFELTQRYGGSALFLAAGGYHHHLGLNLWAGVNVPPPPAHVARLAWVEWVVPSGVEAIAERLRCLGHGVNRTPEGWETQDASGLGVRLLQAAAS